MTRRRIDDQPPDLALPHRGQLGADDLEMLTLAGLIRLPQLTTGRRLGSGKVADRRSGDQLSAMPEFTDSPVDGFELSVPFPGATLAKSRGSLRKVSKQLGDRRFESAFLPRRVW